MKKKLIFLTGTRADYGKIKSLIKILSNSDKFEVFIYVTGMHLLDHYGNTYKEILKDKFENVHISKTVFEYKKTEKNLSAIINDFSDYVDRIRPDLIVLHGDRIEPLAGAIVGAFNNVKIAHIEGGEISGTIDEHIRHAITKFAHYHFVSNNSSKKRLIQMGEKTENVFVIGSPDIDIMLSNKLPSLNEVKSHYEISFDKYAILIYHPVTTEISLIKQNVETVMKAVSESNRNYVVICPNNDDGTEIIMEEYNKFKNSENFRFFPSMRFEMFLTLLKNSEFLIGNSSAGIRESNVYGIPTINVGSRQNGRYNLEEQKNLMCVNNDYAQITTAINNVDKYRIINFSFGTGKSCQMFLEVISTDEFWNSSIQKKFYDLTNI